jgi:hypothetical protein
LFTYGERYSERADQFKNCYLKLKTLYESSVKIETKMQKYSDILDQYENQSNKDYDEMLFDACLRGQKLKNAIGPVGISGVVFCRILVWRVVKAAFVAVVFVAPPILGVLWIQPAAGG